MSFFDKFMRAIGFASNQELENLDKTQTTADNQQPSQTIQNQYYLKNNKDKNTLFFSPNSQEDIINIIEFLKNGARVKINLSQFHGTDLLRAIDFLQGASIALDLTPKFYQNNEIELFK